jgi:succinate dehydrogenase / fumarate reductase membrane anchor subunit
MDSAVRPSVGPVVAPNRWGTISWLFMRVSALALIFLALGHFVIQHVLNDVHNLSLEFVAARWGTLGWRIYDGLLLGLGLAHGLNGLRIVVDDYVVRPGFNRALKLLLLATGIFMAIVGTVALIGGVRM